MIILLFQEIYNQVDFTRLTKNEVWAEIRGFKVKNFSEDIKAVTYHEAQIKRNKKGQWKTTIIFDI